MSNLDEIKWQKNDTLRSMTSKFNQAIDQVEDLQKSSTLVNDETNKKFEELEESIGEQFNQVDKALDDKISSVTAADVGLDKVDNTPDTEKPVSIQQQQAIADAIGKFAEEFTEEAPGEFIEGDDPEVSAPLKQYIEERIQEIGGKTGATPYGIATSTMQGVVRASEEVLVDPETGAMTVKDLAAIKESLNTNNQVTQKIIDVHGDMSQLLTTHKDSFVSVINEVFQLGSEKKVKLVENLTAMGVSCSTSESWESLLAKVLTIMTGYNTSDATMVANQLLRGKIGYGTSGKVTGSMPNRAVTKANGGDAESIIHPDWPSQSMNHSTLTQYGMCGPSTAELSNKFFVRAPEGYYDYNARVYANPDEVARAIGLTAGKIIEGTTVLDVVGTAKSADSVMSCAEIDRSDTSGMPVQNKYNYFDLLNEGYDSVMFIAYDNYNFRNNTNAPVGRVWFEVMELYELYHSNNYSKYVQVAFNGTTYMKVNLYADYFTFNKTSSAYGFQVFGISNSKFPWRTL